MPKKNYADVLAEVKKKILKNREGVTDRPVYRLRLIFNDTSFLKEVAKKQAEEAK
jgi:hypothetical protein